MRKRAVFGDRFERVAASSRYTSVRRRVEPVTEVVSPEDRALDRSKRFHGRGDPVVSMDWTCPKAGRRLWRSDDCSTGMEDRVGTTTETRGRDD
jgi:hypothetical protein